MAHSEQPEGDEVISILVREGDLTEPKKTCTTTLTVLQHYRSKVLDYVCMYGHTYSKSMDQPGKVANPARGQLNRENEYFSVRVRA